MSQVQKGLERIKLAAQKVGGASTLGDRAGVPAHTARRIVHKTPPKAVAELLKLEAEADVILGAEA